MSQILCAIKQFASSYSDLLLDPLFLIALGVGLILRLYQITLQILADDEWHALHQVLAGNYFNIAASFGGADHCIPLTLFYEFCRNQIFLSEWIMRAPLLGAGLFSLLLFPVLLRDLFSTRTSAIFALLLAISPLHVYFSRYARPYTIVLLLSILSAMAFYRWWSENRSPWRWLFVASAVLAPFFHLSALPVVTAPFLFAAVEVISKRETRLQRIRDLIVTGLIVAAGQVILLAPPTLYDFYAVSGKMGAGGMPSLGTLEGALQLFIGSDDNWLVGLLLIIGLAGALMLFRREKRFLLYLIVLGIGQILAVLILRPIAAHVPIVTTRYSLVLLPFLLWFIAIAIDRAGAVLEARWGGFPTRVGVVFIGCSLFLLGPLPRTYSYPNNWTNHGLFQYRYDWQDQRFSYRSALEPESIPIFYQQLAEHEPGSMTLIEAPWYLEWLNNHFPFYQMVHRQKVKIGFVEREDKPTRPGEFPPDAPGLVFRSFVHVGDFGRLAMIDDLSFVIFHKNLANEVPNAAPRKPIEVDYWIELYRDRVGERFYEDEWIVVYDLRH